jgi:hypothetical protein
LGNGDGFFFFNLVTEKSFFLFYLQKCIINLSEKRASQESLAPKKSIFRLVNKLKNFFLAMGLQGFTKCRIPKVVDGRTWEDDLRRLSLYISFHKQ